MNKIILPNTWSDLDHGVFHYIQDNPSITRYQLTESSVLVDQANWAGAEVLVQYDLPDNTMSTEFCSDNIKNSSFTFSFSNIWLTMTHYTFKTRTFRTADSPRGWKVEGSNNNNTWFHVAEEHTEAMLEKGTIKTFKVQRTGTYKYYRFMILDETKEKRYHFSLGKIEVYGEIVQRLHTCQLSRRYNLCYGIFILLL